MQSIISEMSHEVRVPKAVRTGVGLLIVLGGVAFGLLIAFMVARGTLWSSRGTLQAVALATVLASCAGAFLYVGFRLIALKSSGEALVGPRGSWGLVLAMLASSLTSLLAAAGASTGQSQYLVLGGLFLACAGWTYWSHTRQAKQRGWQGP